MSLYQIRSSRPHESIVPRAYCDAHMRRVFHGPIQPMDEPRGFFTRLFGKLG